MKQLSARLHVALVSGLLVAACTGHESASGGGTAGATQTTTDAGAGGGNTGGAGGLVGGGDTGGAGGASGAGGTSPCGDAPSCDDAIDCTIDSCEQDGCHHAATDALCDDGNDCTIDACAPATGCGHTPVLSHACRPLIEVTYPPRAATIAGSGVDPVVEVAGIVTSGAGPIASFVVNGANVPVDGGSGAFVVPIDVAVGPSTIVLDATDAIGATAHGVRSFLWSTGYAKPTDAVSMSGAVEAGLGLWLGPQVIDDGDHSAPPDDFATLMQGLLAGVDVFPPPGTLTGTFTQAWCNYEMHVGASSWSGPFVAAAPVAGGLLATSIHQNAAVELYLTAPEFACANANCTVYFSDLTTSADLPVSVTPGHLIAIDVGGVALTMNGASADCDAVFAMSWVVDTQLAYLQAYAEAAMAAAMTSQVAPGLAAMLNGTVPPFDRAMPLLDGSGSTVTVTGMSDYLSSAFDATGGRLVKRLGIYSTPIVAYDNAGVPNRAGCLVGNEALSLPGLSPLEQAVADDALNQQLFAAWQAGTIEFEVPDGAIDVSSIPATGLTASVSGMLAQTISDCGGGSPWLQIGDISVRLSMTIGGQPVDAQVWATLRFDLDFSVEGGDIAARITGLHSLDDEGTVVQEAGLAHEAEIRAAVEAYLTNDFALALESGPLGRIPLAVFDATLADPTLPAGTSFGFDAALVARDAGSSRAYGQCSPL
jgi:hypothetical protein